MNRKTLYLLFAILIIIAFIIIWFNGRSVKINEQSFLQEVNQVQQQKQGENALPDYSQNVSPATDNSLGITVIKKSSFDKKISLTAGQAGSKIEKGEVSYQAIERNRELGGAYDSASQSQHISGEPLNESSVNLSPGVTKLNKRPTEKESEEMNARGIILY